MVKLWLDHYQLGGSELVCELRTTLDKGFLSNFNWLFVLLGIEEEQIELNALFFLTQIEGLGLGGWRVLEDGLYEVFGAVTAHNRFLVRNWLARQFL